MTALTPPNAFQAALRTDFRTFLDKVFQEIEGDRILIDNWHIDAMVYIATEIAAGRRTRQTVSLPPRYLKSVIFSIALVAWMLGHNPRLRIICASHSMELAGYNARLFRRVIETSWFQATFPQFRIDPKCDTAVEVGTMLGGYRLTSSVGSSLTGRGADLIIIDDPLPADQALSDSARNAVIKWYDLSLESRLDDKIRGAILVVMQRLHLDDLVGHVQRRDGWRHLVLPAIAEVEEKVQIGLDQYYTRRVGEPLCEALEPISMLRTRQASTDPFIFSAQWQQIPIPPEGAIVRRKWFKRYEKEPSPSEFDGVIQSWDPAAKSSPTSNFSACITAGILGKDVYVLDCLRVKLDFPELERLVIRHARDFRARAVLIEDTALGTSLIQNLQRRQLVNIIPIKVRPTYDKLTRFVHQTAVIEAGRVHLPGHADWLADFETELFAFPGSRHDDQVDALSQLLAWYDERFSRPRQSAVIVTNYGKLIVTRDDDPLGL